MVEGVEKRFGVFSEVFSGIGGRVRDFVPCVKLHVYNKLTHSVSTHQILEAYSEEVAEHLGMGGGMPSERSLYRALERIGRYFPVIMDRYQQFIERHGLADSNQVLDFSSTYFEGSKAELGSFGYSRDRRPDRLQVNFGIATGINEVPTALTVQRGNTQDKKHLKEVLRVISKVIPGNSLLIYDAGANSKENKTRIRRMGYNYLTLKSKKVGTYRRHIQHFTEGLRKRGDAKHFEVNGRHYTCVKRRQGGDGDGGETLYIFFSPELYETQIKVKEAKFERERRKGNILLRGRRARWTPSDAGWVELVPRLQRTLTAIESNVYVTGVEGFFILESSVDDEPEKVLKLYKERDKAEKFIRALKEGIELRPIRHWSKWAIIGLFFTSFLTNLLINLTHLLSGKPAPHAVKNVKLLRKFLINLTLTTVYPKNRFKFTVLSNISPQIISILGDSVWKFEDVSLDLRW